MAGLTMMEAVTSTRSNASTHREQGRVPKSLVKTRHERKTDSLMTEAGQRTQEALQM